VKFGDLGLVIIDEEQHFGAAEKVKLSSLTKGVHTLWMSATPIPRTLAAGLAGFRDLSVIATPPVCCSDQLNPPRKTDIRKISRALNDKNRLIRCSKQVLFDDLVGSHQYGGLHRSNVENSASGSPQDVAGITARDSVSAKSWPRYRQR
jgi:hypothetical protein